MGALWSDMRVDTSCAINRKNRGARPSTPRDLSAGPRTFTAGRFMFGEVTPKSLWL